jgi:FkbM family methyltransferase
MSKLHQKLAAKNLTFHHVCEVGVYIPETSNIIEFIKEGIRATLAEADPEIAEKVKVAFASYNAQVYSVAIWDTNGTLKLSRAASSTFATELPTSPAQENDQYRISEATTFEVPCVQFSTIDDGTIDLLSIDIEGGEWYVLKHLRSSPKVLSIETHGKYYTNPFLPEITTWLQAHSYVLWYKDGSDSVFIKEGLFEIGLADEWETKQAEMRTGWKKMKRIFKKK